MTVRLRHVTHHDSGRAPTEHLRGRFETRSTELRQMPHLRKACFTAWLYAVTRSKLSPSSGSWNFKETPPACLPAASGCLGSRPAASPCCLQGTPSSFKACCCETVDNPNNSLSVTVVMADPQAQATRKKRKKKMSRAEQGCASRRQLLPILLESCHFRL